MVYDSVFRVKFRGFRRFYDLFLRRKYLESLVRVIRRFGVRLCATRAKNFRLDIFARRIIMKIERDVATSGRPKEISLVEKTQENRHLAEWRFSRFFIIIVTVKEPICKVIRMVSPPFGWCGRPPAVCAASLKTIVPYHAQKSSPPDREGLLRIQRGIRRQR